MFLNVGFFFVNLKNELVVVVDDLFFIFFLVKCYKGVDYFWLLDKVVVGIVFDLIGLKYGKVDKLFLRSGFGY